MVHHTARRPLELTLGQLLLPAHQPAGGQGSVGILVRQAEYSATASAVGVAGAEAASGGGREAAAAAAPEDGGGSGGHGRGGGGCVDATWHWQLPKRRSVFFGHATTNITRCVGWGCMVATVGRWGSGGVVGVRAERLSRGGASATPGVPLALLCP